MISNFFKDLLVLLFDPIILIIHLPILLYQHLIFVVQVSQLSLQLHQLLLKDVRVIGVKVVNCAILVLMLRLLGYILVMGLHGLILELLCHLVALDGVLDVLQLLGAHIVEVLVLPRIYKTFHRLLLLINRVKPLTVNLIVT